MHVTKVRAPLVGFHSYVGAEPLRKSSFSRTHISRYDDALSHPLGKPQEEIEEFHEQAVFFFPVRQTAGNVIYVEFRFVFEYASPGLYGLNLLPDKLPISLH
jgi:hypothetical protein